MMKMREIEGSSGPDTTAQALSYLMVSQHLLSSFLFYMYSDRKKLCILCLKSYTSRQAKSYVISYYLMVDNLYGLIKYVLGDCYIPL